MKTVAIDTPNLPKEMLSGEALKSFFRDFQGHQTGRCLIRPLRDDDLEDFYEMDRDPEMFRFEIHKPSQSIEDARELLIRWKKRREEGTSAPFALVSSTRGTWIGACNFGIVSTDYHYVAVGFSVARPHWGQGYATEALRGLLSIAFETIGCYRVEANCATAHKASARVMEKTGMKREGILRGKLPVNGVHHDLVYFSMLKTEYPAQRARWMQG